MINFDWWERQLKELEYQAWEEGLTELHEKAEGFRRRIALERINRTIDERKG